MVAKVGMAVEEVVNPDINAVEEGGRYGVYG